MQTHHTLLPDIQTNYSHVPLTIIEPNEEEHSFNLNIDVLEKFLLDPYIADKKVSIVSVAGAFRKGKSFLLNFFLRYLRHLSIKGTDENWLGSDNKLEGFSWRGGSDRDTSGIIIWSEPFFLRDRNGEEIVVLLMDTQGAFDSLSTVKDCATIFALSTMISSIQIFNVSQNIQEDDLQHLQLFTEYGRLALEANSSAKPFQSLIFVVRDWSCPYEAEYGWFGGDRLLSRRLQILDKQHPELQQLRKHIKSSFDEIKCFLMPHPGLVVSTKRDFQGDLEQIDKEFLNHLCTFIPRLFDRNNIILKCINGQPVTCRDLVFYFKAYSSVFQGQDLPEPKSMLTATSEANNLAAVASAKALYLQEMEEVCGGDSPFLNSTDLEMEHYRCHELAIKAFKSAKKMGGDELAAQFLEKLESDITESFEVCVKNNNSKNIFKSMRTPAVLVCLVIVCYIMQEIFQLVGLDLIASIFSLVIMVSIVAVLIWTYSRYSGMYRDLQRKIDEIVKWFWDNVFSVAVSSGVGPTANFTINRISEFQNITKTMSDAKKAGQSKKRS